MGKKLFQKFEKSKTDISNIYGGSEYILTGRGYGYIDGSLREGNEGVTIDNNGCAIAWLEVDGKIHHAPAHC